MTQEEEQLTPEPQAGDNGPGFFSRLLRALIRTLLALLIVAGLIVAGWFIFTELRRSFDVVGRRLDRQVDEIAGQQQSIDQLATRLAGVDESVSSQDGALRNLETSMAENATAQSSARATSQAELGALSLDGETRAQSLAQLTDAVAALQADISAGSSDLDALGGTVDGLASDVAALGDQVDLQSDDLTAFGETLTTADLVALRQTIYLFRIWEMVARARLRLLENNAGLAGADVARSQEAVAALIAAGDFADADGLAQLAQRLDLAAAGLPNSPAAAAADLELAWESIDQLLAALLGISLPTPDAAAPVEATPDVTIVATPELTVTVTTTATVAVTATPAVTATATPGP